MATLEEILGKKVSLPGAEPFFLREKDSTIGILMLHGMTDSPKTMKGLAEALYEKSNGKIASLAPLLSGHGTSAEDLKKITREEWYRDSVEAFEKLQERYESIFLIGFSMGAPLCYKIAEGFREDNKIKGIVSIAGAFDLQAKLKSGTQVASLFTDSIHKTKNEEKEKKENPYWVGYASYPLHAVKELIKLGKESRDIAEKIHVPCLFFQGTKDRLLKKGCAKKICKKIEHVNEKEVISLEAAHLLPTYKNTLPIISEKTYEFIHKILCPMC